MCILKGLMMLYPSRRKAAFTNPFFNAAAVSQAVFFAVTVGIVGKEQELLMWFSTACDTACGTWVMSC